MVTIAYARDNDRYDAMLWSILYWLGDAESLEVPISYTVPKCRFLPDTRPPHSLEKLYEDGGIHAPDRWLCESVEDEMG